MNFYSSYIRQNRTVLPESVRLSEPERPLIPPVFDPCPHLVLNAASRIHSKQAWTASFTPADGYRLLYTISGTGQIQTGRTIRTLRRESVIFCSINQPYRLIADSTEWEYLTLFLGGPGADYYYRMFSRFCTESLSLSRQSSLGFSLEELESQLPANLNNPLWLISALTRICSELILDAGRTAGQKAPAAVRPYLLEIRKELHNSYQKHVALDDLEDRYRISKYRISREFTAAFGKPPITWLNNRRLEAAEALLLETEYRINEIGSQVGFDNTNHFIRLFRRKYGSTPGEYRQSKRQAIRQIT